MCVGGGGGGCCLRAPTVTFFVCLFDVEERHGLVFDLQVVVFVCVFTCTIVFFLLQLKDLKTADIIEIYEHRLQSHQVKAALCVCVCVCVCARLMITAK